MSPLRSRGPAVSILALVVVVAACGSSAPSSASSSAASASAAASAPAPSASASSGAPSSNPSNPPVVAGAFTTGKLHVEISGDVTATFDAPLLGAMSAASAGSTLLTYANSSTGDGGSVVISDKSAGVAALSSSAGVSASGTRVNCTISVTQSDASRVAGTFDCKHVLAILSNGSASGNVDMRGTFEAAR